MYKEIEGDLITLALEGQFDVIAHGCNCFCTMGAGIAPQMAKAFGCDKFPLELERYPSDYYQDTEVEMIETGYRGDINKLGQIDYKTRYIWFDHPSGNPVAMGHKTVGQPNTKDLIVVNAYTQYDFGGHRPFNLSAFYLCMLKINHIFKGKHIGMPMIGAGLGGGNWIEIEYNIKKTLKDMDVTIVKYKP